MDSPDDKTPFPTVEVEVETDYSLPQNSEANSTLTQLRAWYEGLSTTLQVVLGIAALFVTIGLLNAIVHFVTSLLILGILLVVLLILYRLFLAKT